MATARERKATRILERIPGRDGELGAGGRYAYLELEAENVEAFVALRDEAAESPSLRHFDFSGTLGRKIAGEESEEDVAQKKTVVKKAAAEVVKNAAAAAKARTSKVDSAGDEEAAAEANNAQGTSSSAAATEGLSPLEIARQKLLAKRGAK